MVTARDDSLGQQAGRETLPPPPTTRPAPGPSAAVGPPAQLGPAALRALAHPLRIRILDLLPSRGPLTASKLGEILGESSGSASYHLRQLAKHGLVREVEGKGTARERWWERMPGGFSISNAGADSPASRQTAEAVNLEFVRLRHERMLAFVRAGQGATEETLEKWKGSTVFSTTNKWATLEQMEAIVAAWNRFETEHLTPLDGQEGTPGTLPFEIHFNAFPRLDPDGGPL